MISNNIIRIILFASGLFGVLHVHSQNMNNPYSVYGIGDIDFKTYNRTNGMGSTGLAIKSGVAFIDNNPAAISGLPRSFYLAHLSMTGKTSTYAGEPINADNSKNKDMWIKRFELGVKINGWWASSIGFGQFSNVNYKFKGNKFIEGSSTSYETSMEGDGGLNDYHWTNGFSLGKHLSLGIKSSLIAGSINQSEILDDPILLNTLTTKQQDYMSQFIFTGGLIYEIPLNKRWDFSFGGKYSHEQKFSAERSLTVMEGDQVIKEDVFTKADRFSLPQTIAGGISFRHNQKTTLALDYTHEDWSALKIKSAGWQMINNDRITGGVEFSRFRNKQGKEVDYKFFQLGGFYNTGHLQIRNKPVREYGFTLGTGGLIGNGLVYTLSGEVGVKGTTQAKLIKETYFGLTLNVTYTDLLFSKGRKFD